LVPVVLRVVAPYLDRSSDDEKRDSAQDGDPAPDVVTSDEQAGRDNQQDACKPPEREIFTKHWVQLRLPLPEGNRRPVRLTGRR